MVQSVESAKKSRSPIHLLELGARHVQAFWYVLMVILPVILRTGKRPVVFSRFGGMGDIICTIPAALELKKQHPLATFIYNCGASSACIPRMGGVTNFITNCRQIGLVSYWYRWLLGQFYSFSSDDDDLTQDDTLNSIVAFGKGWRVETGEIHPILEITDTARKQALAAIQQFHFDASPLIVLHTGPSSKVRQWPREHWAALIQALNQRGYKNIIQLGARVGSYAQTDPTETRPLPGACSLLEQIPLEQSIALISLADLYIGIDSGLLHAAASVRTPSVGLWGPTTPHFRFSQNERKWFVTSRVQCQGCHHRMPRMHWESGCPHDIKCMRKISVDEVFRSCHAALQSKSKPS